ncbi:MAG: sel1 repeat family protein [Nitrosospira sp.]|nr:sel1 repeat family protein [Nitrosospira sp.]
MNPLVAMLLTAPFLLMLTGCGEKSPESADKSEIQTRLPDEFTSEKQIPSLLEDTLTPDEKSELLQQIMPSEPGNELTPEEKFLNLRKDAEAGDPKAQNGLGVMYYTGEAVSKGASGKILDNDPATAAAWFHRSAAQGYADAQFNLGLMYANGEGVPQDPVKAVELFQKAAEQGNVDAQNNLGVMYYAGEGVPKDDAKAREWFRKAAAQGNADAQANLDAMK